MTIASNDIWVKESPVVVVEGAVKTYSVLYKNDIDSVGSMWLYKNASADASAMLSGTMQKSGKILTLRTIDFSGAGCGGSYYIAAWSAVVNGQTLVRKCKFICKSKKSAT